MKLFLLLSIILQESLGSKNKNVLGTLCSVKQTDNIFVNDDSPVIAKVNSMQLIGVNNSKKNTTARTQTCPVNVITYSNETPEKANVQLGFETPEKANLQFRFSREKHEAQSSQVMREYEEKNDTNTELVQKNELDQECEQREKLQLQNKIALPNLRQMKHLEQKNEKLTEELKQMKRDLQKKNEELSRKNELEEKEKVEQKMLNLKIEQVLAQENEKIEQERMQKEQFQEKMEKLKQVNRKCLEQKKLSFVLNISHCIKMKQLEQNNEELQQKNEQLEQKNKEFEDQSHSDPSRFVAFLNSANLHLAAENCPEIIETLLKHGADIDATDSKNQTPLLVAAASGNLESLTVLLVYRADPDKTDDHGQSALHLAVSKNCHEMIPILLKNKAKINATNNKKQSPILLATYLDRCHCVKALYQKAKLNIADDKGKTAMTYANEHKCRLCVAYLAHEEQMAWFRFHFRTTFRKWLSFVVLPIVLLVVVYYACLEFKL